MSTTPITPERVVPAFLLREKVKTRTLPTLTSEDHREIWFNRIRLSWRKRSEYVRKNWHSFSSNEPYPTELRPPSPQRLIRRIVAETGTDIPIADDLPETALTLSLQDRSLRWWIAEDRSFTIDLPTVTQSVRCCIEGCDHRLLTSETLQPAARFICRNHQRTDQVEAAHRTFDPDTDNLDAEVRFQDCQFSKDPYLTYSRRRKHHTPGAHHLIINPTRSWTRKKARQSERKLKTTVRNDRMWRRTLWTAYETAEACGQPWSDAKFRAAWLGLMEWGGAGENENFRLIQKLRLQDWSCVMFVDRATWLADRRKGPSSRRPFVFQLSKRGQLAPQDGIWEMELAERTESLDWELRKYLLSPITPLVQEAGSSRVSHIESSAALETSIEDQVERLRIRTEAQQMLLRGELRDPEGNNRIGEFLGRPYVFSMKSQGTQDLAALMRITEGDKFVDIAEELDLTKQEAHAMEERIRNLRNNLGKDNLEVDFENERTWTIKKLVLVFQKRELWSLTCTANNAIVVEYVGALTENAEGLNGWDYEQLILDHRSAARLKAIAKARTHKDISVAFNKVDQRFNRGKLIDFGSASITNPDEMPAALLLVVRELVRRQTVGERVPEPVIAEIHRLFDPVLSKYMPYQVL